MNVLVTGAFGWIGTGLVDELLRRGHRVRVFDLPGTRSTTLLTKPPGVFDFGGIS